MIRFTFLRMAVMVCVHVLPSWPFVFNLTYAAVAILSRLLVAREAVCCTLLW